MIERYTRPEMGEIWTENNRFNAWLEVEISACEAWSELGDIPKEDVEKIREKAGFDVARINEIEQETRHDVVAFTRAVSETLGEERKWVHYGLTSTDVVDTALSYQLKQANAILLKDLENFTSILKEKAKEHKYTVMMGRTHGVHAEPTTFGLKLALCRRCSAIWNVSVQLQKQYGSANCPVLWEHSLTFHRTSKSMSAVSSVLKRHLFPPRRCSGTATPTI